MSNESAEQQQNRKKSHRTLVLLAILFGLPYAGAYYLFFSDDATESFSTSNNGQLVSPVRSMPTMSFENILTNERSERTFNKGWTILTLASSNCDVACTDNLYAIKQIRRALGVERSNVFRVMLLTDLNHVDSLKAKLDDFQGMDILTTANENLGSLQELLQINGQSLENALFLFDPNGNYMMYYGPSTHPKLVLKDMQLLLKVSNH